jgi:hypothetical protein
MIALSGQAILCKKRRCSVVAGFVYVIWRRSREWVGIVQRCPPGEAGFVAVLPTLNARPYAELKDIESVASVTISDHTSSSSLE